MNYKQKIAWVKELSQRQGIPNYHIAKVTGISEATISRIFRGEVVPKADTMDKLETFGKSI